MDKWFKALDWRYEGNVRPCFRPGRHPEVGGVRKGRVKAAGSGGGGWRKRSRGSAAATAAADATAAAVPDAAAPLPTAPLLFLLLVCEIGTCAWICLCHGAA